MEDEETGELFIPCRMCCQKCFRIHGKYHEKECFDGCVSFFKVMLGDFTERLSIPPAFASQFIYEREEHMVLQGPSGQEWDVQLLGTKTTLEFRHGWENFVHYHGLQLGDFVVFKYISKLCLKVQIFEKSGCEKDISTQKTNIDLDERCPDQPMLLIDLVCDEEKNDTAEPAPENRRRKKKRKSKLLGHSSKKHGHRLSSQKHMTMEIAAPFKSDKPFYKMVMKSWNVNDPHMLEFRKVLDYPIQLPNQRSEVVLLTGECREWKKDTVQEMEEEMQDRDEGYKIY
ncbi:hypothetical protein SUGI_0774490 [Cryptomeria japonica]|nr:hypothetical protein SUGI_0774490 [Cryptomeria japonica]